MLVLNPVVLKKKKKEHDRNLKKASKKRVNPGGQHAAWSTGRQHKVKTF